MTLHSPFVFVVVSTYSETFSDHAGLGSGGLISEPVQFLCKGGFLERVGTVRRCPCRPGVEQVPRLGVNLGAGYAFGLYEPLHGVGFRLVVVRRLAHAIGLVHAALVLTVKPSFDGPCQHRVSGQFKAAR